MVDRREFLGQSGRAAAALSLLPLAGPFKTPAPQEKKKKLEILIMGGTGFLGPAVVEALKSAGHKITLFNRGKTQPHLFPDLEKLRGDRNKDLSALEGRKWDAVIDNCGYFPGQLRKSTAVLKESGFYLFVSTISVYPDAHKHDTSEESPVGKIDNPESIKRITNEAYGPLKALCEQETTKAFPNNSVIVRPGLIVGPGDWTDRFTYWPARVARGGEMLAPGKPEWGTQYIDVRDLAAWMVRLCESRTTGTYNALGPVTPMPFALLLESCQRVSKSDAVIRWMDTAFMKANKVVPWGEMPLYTHPVESLGRPAYCSNKRAVEAGLTFRSVDDTVKATLDYHVSRGKDRKLRAGISAEREATLLKLWHAQQKSAGTAK